MHEVTEAGFHEESFYATSKDSLLYIPHNKHTDMLRFVLLWLYQYPIIFGVSSPVAPFTKMV